MSELPKVGDRVRIIDFDKDDIVEYDWPLYRNSIGKIGTVVLVDDFSMEVEFVKGEDTLVFSYSNDEYEILPKSELKTHDDFMFPSFETAREWDKDLQVLSNTSFWAPDGNPPTWILEWSAILGGTNPTLIASTVAPVAIANAFRKRLTELGEI